MTGSEIMAVVGFFVLLSGTLWGIWWRIEGKVKEARTDATITASTALAKADLVSGQLAEHKLHVAETYITKAGMRETTDQLMDAIGGVKTAVDNMTARVDRIVENQGPRRS